MLTIPLLWCLSGDEGKKVGETTSLLFIRPPRPLSLPFFFVASVFFVSAFSCQIDIYAFSPGRKYIFYVVKKTRKKNIKILFASKISPTVSDELEEVDRSLFKTYLLYARPPSVPGEPNVNFWKISVRKTI